MKKRNLTNDRNMLARALAFAFAILVSITVGGMGIAQETETGDAPPPPQPGGRKTPVMIEGKSHLPLRVVTRPFSHIYQAADETAAKVKENIEPFSVFYVFTKPEGGGETGGGETGWYEVGASVRGDVLGWMRAEDVVEWKQTLCVEYVHPDDANPVLMFRDQASLAAIANSPLADRTQKANDLYAKIDAGDIGAGFPVISMSPKRAIDFQENFYLMPILDHKEVQYEAWEGRLLKVAAATKAEAGRGATLITDKEILENLTTTSTGGEAELEKIKFDVLFVMDLTRSMQPFVDGALASVKSAAETLGNNAKLKDRIHFGLWGYRDSAEIEGIEFNTKNYTESLQPLTSFSETLAGVKVTQTDSVDYEEDVFAGVHDAMTETTWTPGAVRMIVLVGDAPAHPLGHKWNSTMMSADELRAIADTEKISIFSYHIKDPKFAKFHEAGVAQFTKLAENPGVTTGGGASYYSTTSRDMTQFKQDADVLIAALTQPMLEKIDLQTKPPNRPPIKDEPTPPTPPPPPAREFLRAAVVQWLGSVQDVEAPKDITAWVTDKDLIDPSSQALKVNILLTKNQLDSLVKGLEATLEAGTRGTLSGARFFDELQATSAAAAVKPDQIRNAKRLADTGLIPEFLDGLPYTSEVMDLSDEIWDSWGESRQDEFLRAIEAKVAYYTSLHDTPDAWIKLAEGVDEDDAVSPIPLARLP